MTTGFFTVFRADPQHYLHAAALVEDLRRTQPRTRIVHLTDAASPIVPGVDAVQRVAHGPILERRIESYAACEGEWLLLDTDVSVREDVRSVFADHAFDVALTDRHWPHLPQGDAVMHTMPFNMGVAFSRCPAFWSAVLAIWRSYDEPARANWLSEQRAVYAAVRSGQFRVKILPGSIYNYPPTSAEDAPTGTAILHFKGPHRKAWLSARAYSVLGQAVLAPRVDLVGI